VRQLRTFTSHSVQALAEAAIIALIVLTLIVAPALAAKGGNGGGGGGKGKPSNGGGTITLVMATDANGNGAPNWGDSVTFSITTSATDSPHLEVTCYQNGALVYGASAGFYPDYPWPGAQLMPLSSPSWTSGGADCTAVLNTSLATLRFYVEA
jgi:hypothetical protein